MISKLIKTLTTTGLLLTNICSFSYAQQGNIKGLIKTKDGKPASYVSVQLKEVKIATSSKQDGTFNLEGIKEGKYNIIVSFVGLQTQQKPVRVIANETTTIDFDLVENAAQLTEVVIIATRNANEKPVGIGKLPIKPMDLPQSVAIIGKDVMERQQTVRLSEAVMNVTGIYMMGNTGGGQEELAGRGYAYNSSNTFKNGVRYNNSAMPEMSGLEKIEVMKGSSAILFGNVAAGGIINLVTKKPRFERGGEISFRAGSYSFYKPSIDYFGPIGKSRNVAFRINSSYENAKSFRDVVSSERFYVNPSLLFDIGKKTDILLEADYLLDNRTSDFGTGAVNYEIADVPRSRFLGASWSYYNTRQKTASATITHHINQDWQIRSVTSFQNFTSDLYGTTRPNANNQFVKTDGTWIRGLQRNGSAEKYFITQLDLTGCFKTGAISHALLVGADFDKYITDARAYAYSNPSTGNKNIYDTINIYDLSLYPQRQDIPEITPITNTHTPIKRYGAYVQDLIGITEKVKLLAGIRYTRQETYEVYIDSLQKNNKTPGVPTSDDAFTPRLGVVYQPAKTISIFASYSNSFTLNTGTDIYLQPLAPSYISQYEAGVKTELFNKVVSANVTVYHIVNSNLAQTSLTDANGDPNNNSNIKELAGEVTSKGVEIDFITKAYRGFQLIAGYSYNQTKYTKSNTYVEGSRLRYNPEHTANFSLYYTFDNSTVLRGFNAGIMVYYIGERVAGRSTRVQVPNDTYKLMPIPDYAQLDLSAGYSFSRFSLRAKLSNIFNVLSYYVHDDNSVNPIAPRQLSATLSCKL